MRRAASIGIIIMVRGYGSCIESGGMELDDERFEAPCPSCGELARHHYFQQLDGGSINAYRTIDYDHCGHSSGYDFFPD